jgi:hypothetical protein
MTEPAVVAYGQTQAKHFDAALTRPPPGRRGHELTGVVAEQ